MADDNAKNPNEKVTKQTAPPKSGTAAQSKTQAQAKAHARAGALDLVSERNSFYRRNYRKLMTAMLVVVIANLVVISVLVYSLRVRDQPRYFATTDAGNVIPLVPLAKPLVSREALLTWATEAATAAYTFDFVNWRRQLQGASVFFTDQGWLNFQEGLKSSLILNTVESKQLAVTATPSRKAVILTQGLIAGEYAWRVEVLLQVMFGSASEQLVSSYLVNMLVKRVPTTMYPIGLGIDQFVVSQQTSPTRVTTPT